MTIFSNHAPTGESQKFIVSPNEYSSEGRNIGYPLKFSVYVNKISSADGSVSVSEPRTVDNIQGSRLYLYHRPLIQSDGTISTITVSDGTIDTSLTNARQGYIVFSSLPTADFTVSYSAASDCLTAWGLNTLQDDVMEIEQVLGVTNETGYPGLRNLGYGIFDTPLDSNLVDVAQRAVYLSHLNQDVTIASTDETSLTGTLGNAHTIQLGRELDTVVVDAVDFYVKQSNGTEFVNIHLGNKTGDFITWSGQLSGEGPITVGGPSWSQYSGSMGGDVTTGVYTNSMLRVNGDASFLGDVYAVGSITIVNLTGEISTVVGDFRVTDELTVVGQSHLIGATNTNRLDVQTNIYLDGNLVADNVNGAGGGGQTLVDNLDASEVAHTYRTVTRKVLPNTVLNGRPLLTQLLPKQTFYTFAGTINYSNSPGDYYQLTGFATATAGPSGSYPNIIQMNFTDSPLPIVSGSAYPNGKLEGIWLESFMDPGALELYDINTGFKTPIFGYTVESGDGSYVYKLNLFSPELNSSNRVQTNDSLLLYNKYARPYDFITAAGGASPTFTVFADTSYPLEIAFEDEVRKMTSSTSSISLSTALTASITGLSNPATGVAYIFAKAEPDPELAPSFKARCVPFRMPGETAIGEVVASYDGSWSILDTTSYRPGAVYDSAWIPIMADAAYSGRVIDHTTTSTWFFSHNFGCDIDINRINAELYLGTHNATLPKSWAQNQPLAHSMITSDVRAGFNFSGLFTKIPLTNVNYSGSPEFLSAREASLVYLDSRFIGIKLNGYFLEEIDNASSPANLRLVVRRDS